MNDGSGRRRKHLADSSLERVIGQRDKSRRDFNDLLRELGEIVDDYAAGKRSKEETLADIASLSLHLKRQ